jgi:hypothetical protein
MKVNAVLSSSSSSIKQTANNKQQYLSWIRKKACAGMDG